MEARNTLKRHGFKYLNKSDEDFEISLYFILNQTY
jgi:hypothetical protein